MRSRKRAWQEGWRVCRHYVHTVQMQHRSDRFDLSQRSCSLHPGCRKLALEHPRSELSPLWLRPKRINLCWVCPGCTKPLSVAAQLAATFLLILQTPIRNNAQITVCDDKTAYQTCTPLKHRGEAPYQVGFPCQAVGSLLAYPSLFGGHPGPP